MRIKEEYNNNLYFKNGKKYKWYVRFAWLLGLGFDRITVKSTYLNDDGTLEQVFVTTAYIVTLPFIHILIMPK